MSKTYLDKKFPHSPIYYKLNYNFFFFKSPQIYPEVIPPVHQTAPIALR